MNEGATGQAWIVRGEGGALIDEFELEGLVAIRGGKPGQSVARDLTWADEVEISAEVREAGLGAPYTRMLRDFVRRMQVGDTVLTPGPPGEDVLVGELTSAYGHRGEGHELPHVRTVQWWGRVPRDRFPAGFWSGKLAATSCVDPRTVPRV